MIWAEERSIHEARAAQINTKRENYRQMHKKNAEKKGVLKEFLAAPTITQMRKLLFG
jgi:hypothetical protein